MTTRRPSLPPLPDLSHLTEAERKIIESVLERQREEEEREHEILRNLQNEADKCDTAIRQKHEEVQRKQVQATSVGQDVEAICQICNKTKFADGVGHRCHYCQLLSCSRCGGKIHMKANRGGKMVHTGQLLWCCTLCRKKQELLVKTGQWYHGGQARPVQLDVDSPSDTGSIRSMPPSIPSQDHSKPTTFRRQYSQADRIDAAKRNIQPHQPDRLMRGPHEFDHLDPSKARRSKVDNSMARNDSLSSDPSDCVRPPPPRPHKQRRKQLHTVPQQSLSSSDDDVRTTPDCTSCDDQELESESVSEKGYGSMAGSIGDVARAKPRLARQKESRSLEEDSGWSEPRFAPSPPPNLEEEEDDRTPVSTTFSVQHPVRWEVSRDQTKLTGHMILKKGEPSYPGDTRGNILGKENLGLKVTGGKVTEDGYMGAFITKVKKGSIADRIGYLKPGDEVLYWNNRPLKGTTFEQTYDIIMESKQEPQVELTVERIITDPSSLPPEYIDSHGYRMRKDTPHQTHQRPHHPPSVTVTSPTASPVRQHNKGAEILIKLLYEDRDLQLIVTVIRAVRLPTRANGQPRNPYCKLHMIPEHRAQTGKQKQRTKTVAASLEPKWNTSFVYHPFKESDVHSKSLEVTVYDYDRIGSGEYVGEVLIDLSRANLSDKPDWYKLINQETESITSSITSLQRRGDHLSPPMSVTRLSDSDLSECEYDENAADPIFENSRSRKHSSQSADKLNIPSKTSNPLPRKPRSVSPTRPQRHSEPSMGSSTKRRHLPQIPALDHGTQLEQRAREMKMKIRQSVSTPVSDSEGSCTNRSSKSAEAAVQRTLPPTPRVVQNRRVYEDDARSDVSETSDVSEMSKMSIRSTQSERPRRKLSEFASQMEQRGSRVVGPRGAIINRSQSNTDVIRADMEKNDGSISDSAIASSKLAAPTRPHRKRRPSLGYKVAALVGLSSRKKSSSTSSLVQQRNPKDSASFQRSEEVGAGTDMLTRQTSKDSNDGSISSDGSNAMWLPAGMRIGPEGQFGDFIDKLGPSQLVGRQVLGSACLGEIQMGLSDRKGRLEVEVIRARGLLSKPNARVLPAPYIKVYLMEGKQCTEKQKTDPARRTLDPLYQVQLTFNEPYKGKILQVTVWGDYGRMDRKVFMGVAQILLDDLDLSNIVIGWYKLFQSSSLVGHATHSARRNSTEPAKL
ncbi:DgyrCDS8559 [Dimorphilus gyrociliatus]|uniref:DgyrCDS8559 n=1 Tax=Dimorphilus gyrociliatus TaxID=2664684 RepID=A0A7I8VWT5_9ANNE|nr:DgyrCDS8559 [Dimorphilus gyrociliatus]